MIWRRNEKGREECEGRQVMRFKAPATRGGDGRLREEVHGLAEGRHGREDCNGTNTRC